MNDVSKHPVYIVGVGPGDPDLLTVKAKRVIEEADIIYYDCLPATHILGVASPAAPVRYINKHPEEGEKKEDILKYVCESYHAGKKVVRLKAGDALMFNGGDVEARILHDWGIPFEIIPGVTAACAASSIFGIPTTELHKSNAIIHVIGYEVVDDYAHFRDVAHLVKHGTTIALYMAYDRLDDIFRVFSEEGVGGDTPVVIASSVSLSNQDAALTTISGVEATIQSREMISPFVFFIGQYVEILVYPTNQ